jgi:hypothetical protein
VDSQEVEVGVKSGKDALAVSAADAQDAKHE